MVSLKETYCGLGRFPNRNCEHVVVWFLFKNLVSDWLYFHQIRYDCAIFIDTSFLLVSRFPGVEAVCSPGESSELGFIEFERQVKM